MMTDSNPVTEFTPLELGWGQVCLNVSNIDASLAFYTKLGFSLVGGEPEEKWAIINNAESEIGLFVGAFAGPMINFRGINVQQLAVEMKGRGFELENYAEFVTGKYPPEWSQDNDDNELPVNGSGSFTIKDPDGIAVFFDSVPVERALYEKGQKFCESKITGELLEDQQVVGRMTYCINTADITKSYEFYRRLGLLASTVHLDDGWAVVGCSKPHPFSVSLFQGHINSNLLNFRGGDVFAIGERLAAAGLELKQGPEKEGDGSDGLWLDDPDGHVIYFNTSPGEEL